MPRLFVTATGTGVGKTYAMLRLIRLLSTRGVSVGVCKPVETGVDPHPQDAALLLEELQRHNPAYSRLRPLDLCAYTFPLPAAPFCAAPRGIVEKERIHEKIHQLEERCDVLLVEGAGGLMVPLDGDSFMIDLAKELEAFTLLVTPSRLGCINETLLSLEALQQRGIAHDWCVNLHEDAARFPEVTQPYYDHAFKSWWSLQEGLESFVERFLLAKAI